MAYADKNKGRAYQRRWYHANKEKRRGTRERNKQRIRTWFDALKLTLRCGQCGESHPACLAFHHRDGRTKLVTVAGAVGRQWSLVRIKREIAKCDVLCMNCHLLTHADERRQTPKRALPVRKKGATPYAVDT